MSRRTTPAPDQGNR